MQASGTVSPGRDPNIAAGYKDWLHPIRSRSVKRHIAWSKAILTCEHWGARPSEVWPQPLNVYRVLVRSGATSRLDIAQPRGLTPLVGRESEVTLLLERWEQVKEGQGQVVLLSGDAGIGKSRLVQMLKEHVANEPHTRWECRSSSYFEHTALFPVTDLFQRLLRFQAEDTPEEKVGKLEQLLSQYRPPLEESVPLFAPLLSLALPENAILRSISHRNVNGRRPWKPLSRSFWNLPSITRSCSSWKICTGRTQRPWSC